MCNSVADDWPRRVAILGVGLLGGSVAMAMRRARPDCHVVGYARSEEKCRRLEASGVVDEAFESIAEACRGSDVIVVASPVDRIGAMIIEAAGHAPPDCLITDVGSTKRGIVAAVAADPTAADRFVPAHPIAGSEKSGAEHAVTTLFDGKVVVLTPKESSDPALVEKADHFWKLTGGETIYLSAEQHDAHLAAVSHVPHLVSALVARMADSEARSLVGSGWQDITRVAAGDPTLWTAICQENRLAIGQQLERLASELDALRRVIDSCDDEALKSWLAEAKRMKEQTN